MSAKVLIAIGQLRLLRLIVVGTLRLSVRRSSGTPPPRKKAFCRPVGKAVNSRSPTIDFDITPAIEGQLVAVK